MAAAFFMFSILPETFASSEGTSIFSFLKIDPSPKSAGVGTSNTFISSQSLYVNPAILPWIKGSELSFEQLSYLADSNFSLVNYSLPIDDFSALGLSIGYLGVGGLTKTVADSSAQGYAEKGGFEFNDALVNIAYGNRVTTTFSYGVALKAVRETIDGNTSSGLMLSAGGFYKPQKSDYSCGFGLFNLGPEVKGSGLPSGAYLGFSETVTNYLDWTTEGVAYSDGVINLYTGLEFNINDFLFLRGGYKYPLSDNLLGDQITINFSGGLGVNIRNFEFDYAWVPYGDLGTTNRISVTLKFDGLRP